MGLVVRVALALCLTIGIMQAQRFRGVNLAGAEFGMNTLPGVFGTHYTFNSDMTFRYFAARNLSVVRFPLQWERLQPTLSGPLDSRYLDLLKRTLGWARANGNQVIIEMHNFARYSFNESGRLNPYVIDQLYGGAPRVTRNDLADLWVRLSAEFRDDAAVFAYDLMNEPHDMGSSNWKEISQHVLSAIRAQGDSKLVMIPGDSWSSANRWVNVHGPNGWISDPANNFMYEAHLYFDSDESGTYRRSYDEELGRDPQLATVGTRRVSRFLEWCRSNNARCYLGEYGVPDSDPRWLGVLDNFLQTIDAADVPGSYWAAGDWWGTYPLSVQPRESYTVDRPQMPVLLRHLPPGSFTSLSAASNAGMTFAPESLMSGYGLELSGSTSGATSVPWPQMLDDVTVEITDSTGGVRNAGLVFISPGQINYYIPPDLAYGRVTVAAKRGGVVQGTGTYFVERVAPTIFTATGEARGVAAGHVIRVATDGTRTLEYTAARDGSGLIVAAPIRFGDSAQLVLNLYGTGFRNGSTATVRVGTTPLTVSYAGAQPETPGLDQLNAELPRSLAGAGAVTVSVQVDGKPANPVTLVFE